MVAAHILRHDITGNRARRAAQDDDGDERLLAEAHVHRDRQEDDRQQDELDEGSGAGRAELFDGLRALEPRADAQQRHRRRAAAEHAQELVRHRRKVDRQQRKRQTGENAEDDRVGDDAAQRAPDNAVIVRRARVRRGHGQHEHREDVVERHARHDHQRHKTGISVQILHKCNAEDGLRAAERALCERADHALVAQKERRAGPDGEKVERRNACAEKEELRVELLCDAPGGDVAEQ